MKTEVSRSGSRYRIAALVLAAGRSRRMGDTNKLLACWRGRPLVRHAVEAALASAVEQVYVITGHDAEPVAGALADLPVVRIHNPEYDYGMAASLRAGLRAVPDHIDGVLVCLGDMPLVRSEHLDRLIQAFAPHQGRSVCLPTYRGQRGNPVLLGRLLFADVIAVTGDQGARRLIETRPELVWEVPMPNAGVLQDVDTPAALAALSAACGMTTSPR